MNNRLLYIGLNGYAGSGKDTVAKMLKTILSKDWDTLEDCKEYYKSIYTNPTISATYDIDDKDSKVVCIAFADQLKNICSSIFGIPVERFYKNKATAWICINKDFEYTENPPLEEFTVTAQDYYNNYDFYKYEKDKYWMSLREILVYIGTYVCQTSINKNIFVNIIRNTIRSKAFENKNLNYVILTDIRFGHELEYIRENNGITITITKNDVQQLDNIAEHDLDDEEDYDYIIENNGTYDDLFEQIWNIIHDDIEFSNLTYDLYTRDDTNNYLRLVRENENEQVFKLCSPYHIKRLQRLEGRITLVDPIGGPTITAFDYIPGTKLIPNKIEFDEITNQFVIYIEK